MLGTFISPINSASRFNRSSVFSLPNSPALVLSLRQLETYSGNCIRVRRSSDNTEQNIGFVGGALDTASLLSFVGAGNGFVKTWYDQSGNGYNVTNTTPTYQPKIVSSGSLITKNNKPTIYFDRAAGTNLVNNSISITGSNRAFYSVQSVETYNSFGIIWSKVGNFFGYHSDNQETYLFSPKTIFSPTYTAMDLHIMTWFNGQARINGGENTVSNAFTEDLTGIIIGGLGDGSNNLEGNISEIVAYASNETANLSTIESTANSYYTLY